MRPRVAPLTVGTAVAAGFTAALGLVLTRPPGADIYGFWMEASVSGPIYALLGVFILLRRPGHRIGILFAGVGAASCVQFASGQLAHNLRGGEGAAWAGWLSVQMQALLVMSIVFLTLLFPTGGFVRGRRLPALLAAVGGTGTVLLTAVDPEGIRDEFGLLSPLGVESRLVEGLFPFAFGLVAVAMIAGIASLVVRFRRAAGAERQQLKLFALGSATGIGLIIVVSFAADAAGREAERLGTLVWTAGPLMIPVSAGAAVLRYRLYDIDVIVNKALVYVVLSLVLAGAYLAAVVGLGFVLRPFAAGSDLVVAASTLAVAGLFQPVRRRVQAFIDRRFYRTKYDATRTVATFSNKLRQEVDLELVRTDVLTAVKSTMSPAHAGLWVPGRLRAGRAERVT